METMKSTNIHREKRYNVRPHRCLQKLTEHDDNVDRKLKFTLLTCNDMYVVLNMELFQMVSKSLYLFWYNIPCFMANGIISK